MIIFPAIDILNNKCVRLVQGDFEKSKIYSDNPIDMGKKWIEKGCGFLHVVNLNGADGAGDINDNTISQMVETLDVPIQLGGGIRDFNAIDKYIKMGINRVILGTAAIENKEFLKEAVDKYGEKIVVSVDSRNGFVATKGWRNITEKNSIDFSMELEKMGVSTVVFTDILKDGLLKGPNFEIYKTLGEKTNLNVIASGGVSTIEDIIKLSNMNMYGSIMGKALYEERVSLEEVIECLQKE
jgi:phosphoribosylformimino-5-aminoimidazole carboxamide ribotide isomerase